MNRATKFLAAAIVLVASSGAMAAAANTSTSGVKVCLKAGTEVQAPKADGSCNRGFTAVTVARQADLDALEAEVASIGTAYDEHFTERIMSSSSNTIATFSEDGEQRVLPAGTYLLDATVQPNRASITTDFSTPIVPSCEFRSADGPPVGTTNNEIFNNGDYLLVSGVMTLSEPSEIALWCHVAGSNGGTGLVSGSMTALSARPPA